MYQHAIHQHINTLAKESKMDIAENDNPFYTRLMASVGVMHSLYQEIYQQHPDAEASFYELCALLMRMHQSRDSQWRKRDEEKLAKGFWYLSQDLVGMSLYTDRFCGRLDQLTSKLSYFEDLGVNFLHLMPLFDSPPEASDGGYAVRDFRKVDTRFGTIEDLRRVREELRKRNMYLMLDIVLNHTSDQHEWALKARAGEKEFQDFYYFFPDRQIPDQYESGMPEIFPEAAPGNFTYIAECGKWVMTVFHQYQWDLNYSNPRVLLAMIENVLFYANLGVDVLRIDAPAFIWKQTGTSCQNLPQAHTLLRLIRQCVQVAAPGMALLGEAIVAPEEIMQYFGTGAFKAKECDFAYNATHMALQWDMLATGDTRVMLAAQHSILQKPFGTSWITYTRCHDDIGLGYNDHTIREAGWDPRAHRHFLQQYYSGKFADSPARGDLFSYNPRTGDARISGSLASLCGLETAREQSSPEPLHLAIKKILLMQAHSFFLGGLPMLYYGDEVGYTNDYSFESDPARHYDNRWMHRPTIDWEKNNRRNISGSIEQKIFEGTARLAKIRRSLPVLADHSNIEWLSPFNRHIAGFVRSLGQERLFAFFNFHGRPQGINWNVIAEKFTLPEQFFDHWSEKTWRPANARQPLLLDPYSFVLLDPGNSFT
ncbi:MAG: amylosucrase [Chitinophagaceae bacterium]